MAKQKFSCKGVVRATGQRASVMISADNREAALQIADKHGVTVESIMPMAEPPARQSGAAHEARARRSVRQRKRREAESRRRPSKRSWTPASRTFSSADDEDLPGGLDDLDLGDDADEATASFAHDEGLPLLRRADSRGGGQVQALRLVRRRESARSPRQARHATMTTFPRRARRSVSGRSSPAPRPFVVIVPIVARGDLDDWRGTLRCTPARPVAQPVAVSPPVALAPPPAPKPEAYKPSPEEIGVRCESWRRSWMAAMNWRSCWRKAPRWSSSTSSAK